MVEKQNHNKNRNYAALSGFYRPVLLLCLLLVILTGCTNKTPAKQEFAPDDEHMLVVYTSHKEEVYGPIIREFEQRTGIWVQVVTDGSNRLLERIRSEQGDSYADVMFGGGVDTLNAYTDCFEPYRGKDYPQIGSAFKSEGNYWTPFSSLPIVFIYNNKLVYADSVPTSWKDLLDEKWKGQIAFADPGTSGTSYTSLATMLQICGIDNEEAVIRDLCKNLDGKVLSGSGAVPDTVASGTRLIGVTLEEVALKRQAVNPDISIVYPVEGTSAVPDGSALVKGAKHEENAKRFLDFIIGYDVQRILVEQCGRRPVRKDVVIEDKRFVNITEIKFDIDWASGNQSRILREWNSFVEVDNED